jgi:hypothetical protein
LDFNLLVSELLPISIGSGIEPYNAFFRWGHESYYFHWLRHQVNVFIGWGNKLIFFSLAKGIKTNVFIGQGIAQRLRHYLSSLAEASNQLFS